jgi:hypothetical protein
MSDLILALQASPSNLSPEEIQRRKAAHALLKSATKQVSGIDDARKRASKHVVMVPLIVLGVMVTKTGKNLVTAMVAPLDLFPKYELDKMTIVLPDKRRAIQVIRDIRSKEKKEEDGRSNYDINKAPIHVMDDVENEIDTVGEVRRASQNYVELALYNFLYEPKDSRVVSGVIALAEVETAMWHAKDTKKISRIRRLSRVIECLQMPVFDLVATFHKNDIFTHQLRSTCAKFFNKTFRLQLTEDEKKALSYTDNYIVLPTGWPDDYTHPRYGNMRPNCNMVRLSVKTQPEVFRIEVQNKEKSGEKEFEIMLDLTFEVHQWRDLVAINLSQLIVVTARVFKEHLQPLGISSVKYWVALMKHTYDLLLGVFVGREDANATSLIQGNRSKLELSARRHEGQARDSDLCDPPAVSNDEVEFDEERSVSFYLSLNTCALFFDPVQFIQSVAVRISAECLRKYWDAGKSSRQDARGILRPPKLQHLNAVRKVSDYHGKALIPLSEMDPASDVSSIVNDPNVELRAFLSVFPDALEKRAAYAHLSRLSKEDGDLFFAFVKEVFFDATMDRTTFFQTRGLSDRHPAVMYHWSQDDTPIAYIYAINKSLIQTEHDEFERNLGGIDLKRLNSISVAPSTLLLPEPLPSSPTAAVDSPKKKRTFDEISKGEEGDDDDEDGFGDEDDAGAKAREQPTKRFKADAGDAMDEDLDPFADEDA